MMEYLVGKTVDEGGVGWKERYLLPNKKPKLL